RWATSRRTAMDGLLILLGVLIALEVLGLPILVVLYLSERSRVAQRLHALGQELVRIRSALAGTGAMAGTGAPTAERAAAAERPAPAPPRAPTAPPVPPAASVPTVASVPAADWVVGRRPPAAAPAAPRESLEERVMRRWAVWLGAVALAFGAYFLVKFSIEQGWFGPASRVIAGAALGLVLWVLSEWVRQRDLRRPLVGGMPHPVPPALPAACSCARFPG